MHHSPTEFVAQVSPIQVSGRGYQVVWPIRVGRIDRSAIDWLIGRRARYPVEVYHRASAVTPTVCKMLWSVESATARSYAIRDCHLRFVILDSQFLVHSAFKFSIWLTSPMSTCSYGQLELLSSAVRGSRVARGRPSTRSSSQCPP